MPRKPLVHTPGEVERDQRDFERAQQVLGGAPRPDMDGASSKTLRFILHYEAGCDASISREAFSIRFGASISPSTYFLTVAPVVLGQLLTWAGVERVEGELHAVLEPREIPATGFMRWSYGVRHLWLLRTHDLIVFSVRAGPVWTGEPPRLEPIVRLPRDLPKVYKEFSPPISCPHCQASISRARRFSDGSYCCPSCARSFDGPEGPTRL